MKKGLISVVIPCFNVSAWLDDCFASVSNQTYKNAEYIFVNDGSTDDTLEKLSKFCHGKPNCKLVDQKNKGLSGARNSGVAVAEGEWLYFYDPDDLLSPHILQALHDLATKSGVGCAVCKNVVVDEKFCFADIHETPSAEEKICFLTQTEKILKKYIRNKFRHEVWNKIYSHERAKQMEGYPNLFDENIRFSEDIDFNFRYLKDLDKVAFSDRALYYYRVRGGSLMSEKFNDSKLAGTAGYEKALEYSKKNLPALCSTLQDKIVCRKLHFLLVIANGDYANEKVVRQLVDYVSKNIFTAQNKFLWINFLCIKNKLKKRFKNI